MGTIHQGGWDTTDSDRDRWRDENLGAVAARSTAGIKVAVVGIIARRVAGQNDALASWNRERAPQTEHLAARDRGMVVDRDFVDQDIARAAIVEPNCAPVIAVGY